LTSAVGRSMRCSSGSSRRSSQLLTTSAPTTPG
jgi:hypothetical protein